jgi:hypothetical protein
VMVEGGPGTLPSWVLIKQQLGLPVGAGDPIHSSRLKTGTVRRWTWEPVPLSTVRYRAVGMIWYGTLRRGTVWVSNGTVEYGTVECGKGRVR